MQQQHKTFPYFRKIIFVCFLRKNLECKTFKWYLDNIYPELFIPGEAVASGEVIMIFNSDNKNFFMEIIIIKDERSGKKTHFCVSFYNQ